MSNRILNLSRNALAHPALLVLGLTALLFLATRIPALIFYGEFNASPDDAGLNSVQVLVQGSALILGISLGIALIYGLVFPIWLAIYAALTSPLLAALGRRRNKTPWAKPERWQHRAGRYVRGVLGVAPLVVPLLTLFFATFVLVEQAHVDADAIKHGREPHSGSLSPWTSERVTVIWTTKQGQIPLPDCKALFFLGESGGRVLLYDSNADVTHRIESSQVELTFPQDCGD